MDATHHVGQPGPHPAPRPAAARPAHTTLKVTHTQVAPRTQSSLTPRITVLLPRRGLLWGRNAPGPERLSLGMGHTGTAAH